MQNLVKQGNLLNQPEVDCRTGEFYPVINTSQMWDFGPYNYDMYNTEIARRSSLLVQSIAKAWAARVEFLPRRPGSRARCGRAALPTRCCGVSCCRTGSYVEDGIDTNPYAFSNME